MHRTCASVLYIHPCTTNYTYFMFLPAWDQSIPESFQFGNAFFISSRQPLASTQNQVRKKWKNRNFASQKFHWGGLSRGSCEIVSWAGSGLPYGIKINLQSLEASWRWITHHSDEYNWLVAKHVTLFISQPPFLLIVYLSGEIFWQRSSWKQCCSMVDSSLRCQTPPLAHEYITVTDLSAQSAVMWSKWATT